MKKHNLYKELCDISIFLGNDINLVQGGGGNTSVKIDGELLVKASGFWLADAGRKKKFVSLKLKSLLEKIEKSCLDSTTQEITFTHKNMMQPSIETTMHALMPHRFVVHIHSVNVLAYAVRENGFEKIKKILNDVKLAWVPYVKPGMSLTRKMYDIKDLKPDVVILGNHGLIIGGDNKNDIFYLLKKIEDRLKTIPRKTSGFDKNKMNELLIYSGYKLPKYDFCHSLAFDALSLQLINKPPLYPDHVVFIGVDPIPVVSSKEFMSSTKTEKHKIVIIKNVGVAVSKNFSKGGEEMLHCVTDVFLRIKQGSKLRHLTTEEIKKLVNWDAEKYRKTINR
jgi:rhamnose utilization protein RhaD (predicted bifunctional aldolase and dehydrogenase)